jgi:hypothetical protein
VAKAPPCRAAHPIEPRSLIRGIAFKIQERAYGGLNPAAQRRLRSLAGERTGSSASVFSPGITPKPATKLVREWQGRAHTVTVLEEGFDYGGERYRSLTHIAKRITGSHWSGPLFFGLRSRSSRAPSTAEHLAVAYR